MSRIGKKEINIPEGVVVTIQDTDKGQQITAKGPNGELSRVIRPEIKVSQEANILSVTRKSESRQSRSLHGLTRTLVSNMVVGVKDGFKKELEIVGVGYRAVLKGVNLDFQIGKSHPVIVEPPAGITFAVADNTKLTVSGPDKQLVGQIAANIISIRKPEPYKGKGIRVKGQRIKRKAGKSGTAK
jgi:large subunit ribosomal protein L6